MSTLYAPLTNSKNDIRLLSIITEPSDTHVTCKLTTTSLSSHPRYTALSYFWGDPKVTEDILVNGRVRSVTTTLATALRHIAKHWTSVYPDEERGSLQLWADAVCIDQDNDLEKNHQVNLMGEIYRRAEMVIAWLGIGGQIDNALANLHLLAKEIEMSGRHDLLRLEWLCRFPNLCVDDIGPGDLASPFKNRVWRDIISLFRLPYWERVWIFQEAVFAKKLLFCTDNVNLAYRDMTTVWQGLSAVKVGIKQGFVACPEQLSGTTVWTFLATDSFDWASINYLNAAQAQLSSLAQQSNSLAGAQLGGMSFYGRAFKASNPKDHIYGLRSLADLGIEVDYSRSKSVKDVYCDYISALLPLLRSAPVVPKYEMPPLMFLHYAGIGMFDNSLGLPTYAPNYPEESNAKLTSTYFTGHADSSVFPAEGSFARIEDAALAVPGVRVDAITGVEAAPARHTWQDGTCLEYFQQYVAGAHHSDRVVPPLQTIVRTLQLDADGQMNGRSMDYALCLLLFLVTADAENIDAHFGLLGLEPPAAVDDGLRFNQSFIRALCPDWTGPTHTWRDILFRPTQSTLDLLEEVAFDLVLLQKRWRFFNTTTGFIGLAPLKTQPGDLVFVLKESHVPVILRKQEDHYLFVGVCFVLDLMSGSLVAEKVRAGELVIEQIRIL